MRSWRHLRDRPALYTPTRAGIAVTGLTGLSPVRVSPAGAMHAVACAQAAAALAVLYPHARVVGEPEIRQAEQDGGQPLASVPMTGLGAGGAATHRADLALCGHAAGWVSPIAVEVELSVKEPRRLAAICTAWARCHRLAGVLYVAPAHVRGPLGRALARTHAGHRISVVDPDELVAAALRCRQRTARTSSDD
jgi:hypothetical protein